jgi:hypothetical protein
MTPFLCGTPDNPMADRIRRAIETVERCKAQIAETQAKERREKPS